MENLLTFFGVGLSFAVTLGVVWTILVPLFFTAGVTRESVHEEEESQSAKREELLAILEEVETDKLSGKLSPEEYAVNRGEALRALLQLVEPKKSE